jgi:hypothetical protein
MRRAALRHRARCKLQKRVITSICKSGTPSVSVEDRRAEEERDMVSKREVVQDESALESCLQCEINDLVQGQVE